MRVTSIDGPRGPLTQIVADTWRSTDTTLCVFLDNPRNGAWIILTVDLTDEIEAMRR